MARSKHPKSIVVDTNVILSAFELLKEEEKDREEFHDIRKGWAWLLLMYCDRRGVTTLSLHELQYQTTTLLPNTDLDIARMMRVVLWVAHDVLLPKWKFARLNGFPQAMGKAGDTAYLQAAKKHGFDLVTNEDWIASGIREPPKKGSLRKRAVDAGVPVYTPREFVMSRKFDPAWHAGWFFQRWERLREETFKTHKGDPIPAQDVRDVETMVRHVVALALKDDGLM